MEEDGRATKHDDALKKLGNVNKKRMSPMILKDFLGADGTVATMGLKKPHKQALLKHRKKLEWINIAVDYFGKKIEKKTKYACGLFQSFC